MKTKLKNRWLFFLPLFFTSVMGEMVINAKGLPTPWPITLISVLISVVGIFTFSYENFSFGWFAKITFSYNIFRSLCALFMILHSLLTGGIKNFQYPSFTLMNNLPLILTIMSIGDGLEELKFLCDHGVDSQELSVLYHQRATESIITEETPLLKRNNERELKKNYKTLKKVYRLRYLCWGIVAFNFAWEIFFDFYISSCINPKNYLAASQFITSCAEPPTYTKWGKTWNGTKYALVHCEEDSTCFIKDIYLRSMDTIVQTFGIFFLLKVLEVKEKVLKFFLEKVTKNSYSFERKKFPWRKFFAFFIYTTSSLVLLFFLLGVIWEQFKGLNPEGLEKCDLNLSLLSSKTGYFQEWWLDKLNTIHQFF